MYINILDSVLLILISSMVGCNNTKIIDKPTNNEHIMDNTAEKTVNYNNIKIDEMNRGKDVISAVFLNDKFYYYRLTDEVADEVGNEFCSFCSFDINSNEERIIDTKIVGETQPVLYKDKIYYVGSNSEFIEYNPDTEEKKKLNVNIEFLYRYSDDNIYAYKVNAVEKIDLYSNTKTVILPEVKEIYFIWEMNVTKDYVFFLAQDTKEVEDEIYRLNLYRMKKDGSELKKIYSTDYTRDIIFAEHFIYDIGDKLLMYERNENNYLSGRNKFQLIDYEGNEIDSSVINYR